MSSGHGDSAAPDSDPGAAAPERLLAYLARGLVEHPDEVVVERFEEGSGAILLELSVADTDYGKVIGRGGGTAQALRTVVRALAGHGLRKVVVDIVD